MKASDGGAEILTDLKNRQHGNFRLLVRSLRLQHERKNKVYKRRAKGQEYTWCGYCQGWHLKEGVGVTND